MSEETKVDTTSGVETQATSGAAVETSGSIEETTKTETQKAGESDHVRKLQKELNNYREKSKALEREKLEAAGEKDKLIENLRGELSENKAKEANAMRAQVKSQIKAKAAEMGCLNSKFVLAELDVDSFEVDPNTLEITNTAQLTEELETFRKENPFVFKQAAPKLADGTPTTKVIEGGSQDYDLSKMTAKEIIERERKIEQAKLRNQ